MRWSLEQQLANVDAKIKDLQKRKKAILEQISEAERQKEQESLQALHSALQKNGVTPDRYDELILKINGK